MPLVSRRIFSDKWEFSNKIEVAKELIGAYRRTVSDAKG